MKQQVTTSERKLSLDKEEIELITEFANKMRPGTPTEWKPMYHPENIRRIFSNFK